MDLTAEPENSTGESPWRQLFDVAKQNMNFLRRTGQTLNTVKTIHPLRTEGGGHRYRRLSTRKIFE